MRHRCADTFPRVRSAAVGRRSAACSRGLRSARHRRPWTRLGIPGYGISIPRRSTASACPSAGSETRCAPGTPIREALARLEGDGLIVREGNGRLHVAALLDRGEFEQLYVARLALEPLAASLAASGATGPELTQLRESITQMKPAARQGNSAGYASFLAADTAFHETIACAGRNRFLADAVHHLHSHHRLAFLYRQRGVSDWQVARREHALIADAIADRASERAEQLMRAHIGRSRQVLRAEFGSTLSDDSQYARPQLTPAPP